MILKFDTSNIQGKLPYKDIPPALLKRKGIEDPAEIQLLDGTKTNGSCIRCPDAPCIYYYSDEIESAYFKEFPADTSRKVCPTNVLEIDPERGSPKVDIANCIYCGLCVARCPVHAIVLTSNGIEINDKENDFFKFTGDPVNSTKIEAILREYRGTPVSGSISNYEFMTRVFERIVNIGMRLYPQFPNILVRNFMLGIGVPYTIRRLGDTNIRIDSVFFSGENRIGVAEIEFTEGAILNAPRDVLDDLAVIHSRYHYDLQAIDPLIVSLRFPNRRSEYWQVIQDISNELNIQISSISIGALFILMWENIKLNEKIWARFYADASIPTIEPVLGELIGIDPQKIDIYPGWAGASK